MIDRSRDVMTLHYRRGNTLKAGDNSHLKAEHWILTDEHGEPIGKNLTDFEDLGAKVRNMGTTNVGDVRASLRATTGLKERFNGEHVVVNSKHTRGVIVAKGETQLAAMKRALAADPNSPFGGFWSFSHPVNMDTAEFANMVFAEGFMAPDFEEGTAELLRATKRKEGEYANPHNLKSHQNRFLLRTGELTRSDLEILSMQVMGADAITQDYDGPFDANKECFVAAGNEGETSLEYLYPAIQQAVDFGGNVAPYLNSNLVFFATSDAIAALGDGCGSRYVAARKARSMLEESIYSVIASGDQEAWDRALVGTPYDRSDFEGLIAADFQLILFSDAFFPKPDGFIEGTGLDRVEADFQGGRWYFRTPRKGREEILLKRVNFDPEGYNPRLIPKAVVQPGGSLGDKYTMAMADQFGIPMVLTMSPDKAEEYLSAMAEGKSPGVTGRRFFGHQSF